MSNAQGSSSRNRSLPGLLIGAAAGARARLVRATATRLAFSPVGLARSSLCLSGWPIIAGYLCDPS